MVGQTRAFAASGRLSYLSLVPLVRPRWRSSEPSRTDVTQAGVATANAPGNAKIYVDARLHRLRGRAPPIPEPETWAMFALGLAALSFMRHKRRIESDGPAECKR